MFLLVGCTICFPVAQKRDIYIFYPIFLLTQKSQNRRLLRRRNAAAGAQEQPGGEGAAERKGRGQRPPGGGQEIATERVLKRCGLCRDTVGQWGRFEGGFFFGCVWGGREYIGLAVEDAPELVKSKKHRKQISIFQSTTFLTRLLFPIIIKHPIPPPTIPHLQSIIPANSLSSSSVNDAPSPFSSSFPSPWTPPSPPPLSAFPRSSSNSPGCSDQRRTVPSSPTVTATFRRPGPTPTDSGSTATPVISS